MTSDRRTGWASGIAGAIISDGGTRERSLICSAGIPHGVLRKAAPAGGGHRVYTMPWSGDPRANIRNAKGMAKPCQFGRSSGHRKAGGDTVSDHYTYQITWSAEGGEHVGLYARVAVSELAGGHSRRGAVGRPGTRGRLCGRPAGQRRAGSRTDDGWTLLREVHGPRPPGNAPRRRGSSGPRA